VKPSEVAATLQKNRRRAIMSVLDSKHPWGMFPKQGSSDLIQVRDKLASPGLSFALKAMYKRSVEGRTNTNE
jgi:hypothetical protein